MEYIHTGITKIKGPGNSMKLFKHLNDYISEKLLINKNYKSYKHNSSNYHDNIDFYNEFYEDIEYLYKKYFFIKKDKNQIDDYITKTFLHCPEEVRNIIIDELFENNSSDYVMCGDVITSSDGQTFERIIKWLINNDDKNDYIIKYNINEIKYYIFVRAFISNNRKYVIIGPYDLKPPKCTFQRSAAIIYSDL